MRTREVDVDGIRLSVTEAGEGPALVLLHGLAATHAVWLHTIPAFADRWRVIAPDLPGHGTSGKPNAPYSVDFYAGVIRSLGRELGVREAVVVGNSLGGQIAVELALMYPVWTRALVLAAPAGGFGALRTISWAVGAGATQRVLRLALPRAVPRCFHDPALPACTEERRLLDAQLARDDFPDFARAIARSLAGVLAASHQHLHRVHQPTLLVWGREDRLVAYTGSRRVLREVPHARLVLLERCGHMPMLEQPRRFNEAVQEFLRAVAGAPLPGARQASGGR